MSLRAKELWQQQNLKLLCQECDAHDGRSLPPDILPIYLLAKISVDFSPELLLLLQHLKATAPHQALTWFVLSQFYSKNNQPGLALDAHLMAHYLNPAHPLAFESALKIVAENAELINIEPTTIALVAGGPNDPLPLKADALTSGVLGGSESALIYLALELKKLQKNVTVFCNTNQKTCNNGVWFYPITWLTLAHHQNPFQHIIALRVPDALRKALFRHKNFTATLWLQDDIQTRLYSNFDPKNYHLDRVHVLSEFHQQRWQKRITDPQTFFYKTRNGYDPSLFYNTHDKRHQIIFASRPERGLDMALQVFKKLKAKFPQLKMRVATYIQGEDPKQDLQLAPFLSRLKADGIVFTGGLKKGELAHELNRSYFLLHPNVIQNIETSCIMAIEAQACGTPVICGEGGALAETVLNNKTGFVCSYTTQQELAESLFQKSCYLIENSDLWHTLSKRASDHVNPRNTWSQIAQEWEQNME